MFSLFPLCNLNLGSHKDDWTVVQMFVKYLAIMGSSIMEVFERSYVSLATLTLGMIVFPLFVESTLSGRYRFLIGSLHGMIHFLNAVSVLVIMEMIIEVALENGLIGQKSAFDTFLIHFPTLVSLFQHLDANYSHGFILKILKMVFSVVDITGFHVALRQTMCNAKIKQYGIYILLV